MPTPFRSPAGVSLSRRAALTAFAAVLGGAAVGCTSTSAERQAHESAPPPPEPSVDPDVAVAAEALANQRQAVSLLEATSERHARLAARLAPALDAHRAHAAMLARAVPDGVPVRPSPAVTGSPSPSEPASPSSSASPDEAGTPVVPRNRSLALVQVVAAERDLAIATKRHAFRAQSGAFARLLASMAAASAQYATVLAPAEGAS